MVSFQCDACTDVVKKPKLDHHSRKCHSSFTCIDCSTTFSGPTEWKNHTSCVTEAEKYQKGLYKGPKKGLGAHPGSGPRGNGPEDYTNAPGKYSRPQNDQSNWSRPQYVRSQASGANTTPLGSPPRMSPVEPSPVESSAPNGNAAAPKEKGSGKGKKRGAEAVAETKTSGESEPKKKKRKTPKEDTQGGGAKDTKTNAAPERLQNSPSEEVNGFVEKPKKSKKSKDKSSAPEVATPAEETAPEGAGDDGREKKKRRKGKKNGDAQPQEGLASEEAIAQPEAVPAEESEKGKKKKRSKAVADGGEAEAVAAPAADGGEPTPKELKKKGLAGDDLAGGDNEKKPKRKRKKSKAKDAEVA